MQAMQGAQHQPPGFQQLPPAPVRNGESDRAWKRIRQTHNQEVARITAANAALAGNHSMLYKASELYTTAVDLTIAVPKYTAWTIGSFAYAAGSTVCKAVELGPKGSAVEAAKWALGVNNVKDAWKELGKAYTKQDAELEIGANGDVEAQTVKAEAPGPAKALGKAVGHLTMGLGKVTFGTGLWTYGTVRNILNSNETVKSTLNLNASITSLGGTAEAFASGINGIGRLAVHAAYEIAIPQVRALSTAAWNGIQDPSKIRGAATATQMAAGLYIAASEGRKAADAGSMGEKITHGALAAAGLVLTAAAPYFMYGDESTFQTVASGLGILAGGAMVAGAMS